MNMRPTLHKCNRSLSPPVVAVTSNAQTMLSRTPFNFMIVFPCVVTLRKKSPHTSVGSMPMSSMCSRTAKARSSSSALRHASISAEHVTPLGTVPLARISLNSRKLHSSSCAVWCSLMRFGTVWRGLMRCGAVLVA